MIIMIPDTCLKGTSKNYHKVAMPTWLSTNEAKPTFAFENKPGNVFIPTFEKWKVQAHQNGTNSCFLSKHLVEKKNLFTLDHSLQNVPKFAYFMPIVMKMCMKYFIKESNWISGLFQHKFAGDLPPLQHLCKDNLSWVKMNPTNLTAPTV